MFPIRFCTQKNFLVGFFFLSTCLLHTSIDDENRIDYDEVMYSKDYHKLIKLM